MVFRNLTLFRFPASAAEHWFDDRPVDDGLSFSIEPPSAWTCLEECRLKPVGPLELSSRGFIPPHGVDSETLMHRSGDAVWITVGGEDRVLPGSVVAEAVRKKLADIERTEGRKPGFHTRKRIKDEIVTDLLPRAFVKPSRVDAIIDLAHGIIAVDTSSRRLAESVVSEVRRALGSFPALPLNAEVAPRSVLTDWLVDGAFMPEELALGDECELRDPVERGAVVKCSRQDLQGDEVGKHLEAGKQVTRLELTLNDHVSFVIGEDLVVRKFRLLDGATESLDITEQAELHAELDARFALMAGELHALFSTIESAFRVSKAEG